MKPTTLLLVASLTANAALVAIVWLRLAPPAPVAGSGRSASGESRATGARKPDALNAALASGDVAALTAAGVSPEIINQLAAARAFGRLAKIAREQDRLTAPAPTDYWRKVRATPPARLTREQRAERSAAEQEFSEAMRLAFGEDPFSGNPSRNAFLSPSARDRLARIDRDYDEMRREVSQDAQGVQLATDREKLRLLDAERERDIAAVLSPAEQEQMSLRASHSANVIIDRYGDLLASEDEYKQLYAIQKAFDDKYSTRDYTMRPRTPEEERARADAERQLNDNLRAAIGEDRWAAISRDNDNEYRALNTLTTRLGLPAEMPDQVYALRDTYAAQSIAINQNIALTAAERRTQMTDLANRAKADLRAKLGPDGADNYVRQATWLQALQDGRAFTTDAHQLPAGSPRPPGNTTAFPLPAPRPAPPPKS